MKIKVTKDLCEIKENEIWNVGDYNVHTVQVELSPEFNGLVNKVRYFVEDKSYDMLITDNVAQVPYEATVMEGTIKIGVYGYDADTDILVQSTSPVNKYITSGTYTGDPDNTQPLTPTDKEQMESAIQKNTNDITDLKANKQDKLISGVNIKTINNESILSGGNLTLVTEETDPIFTNSPAYSITDNDITYWNNKANMSDIPDVSNFITKDVDNLTYYTKSTDMQNAIDSAVNAEKVLRENADVNLQNQIDAITVSSDVVDVVSTYQDLVDYDTQHIKANDIIKVMQDSTHDNAISYYRWVIVNHVGSWVYVGSEGPYYTKSETDTLLNAKQNTISPTNKLQSDLVDDTNQTNLFVTSTEKTTWNNKLDQSDLTDYVKNTDYASSSKGGVIKTGSGTNVDNNGVIYADNQTYSDYSSSANTTFISKGTLENVITGKNLETANNKVTNISSSSTDVQYPSAKCVYDNNVIIKDDVNTKYDYLFSLTNLFEKITGTGTSVTLNDTSNTMLKLGLNGNTTQNTTTGKNLIPNTLASGSSNGITYTVNSDGSIKLSGTATARVEPYLYYDINNPITFKAGTYRNTSNRMIILYANGYNTIYANSTLTLDEDKQVTIAYFRIENEETVNETYYPQIILNSIIDTSYEPYTGGQPAPSPSYPQTIHTITGNNDIKIRNKQMYNYIDLSSSYNFLTYDNDGWYTAVCDRTNQDTGDYFNFSTVLSNELKTNTTYSIVTEIKLFNTTGNGGNLNVVDRWGQFTTGTSGLSTVGVYVQTSTTKSSFDNLTGMLASNIYVRGNSKVTAVFRISVIEGTDVTADNFQYEPYKQQTYPINLGDIEICKIEDYQDVLFKNTMDSDYYDSSLELNKWYLKKNVGKVVLDGSEDWYSGSYGTNSYSTYVQNLKASDNNIQNPIFVMSNLFKGISYNDRSTGNNIAYSDVSLGLYIRNTSYTSLVDFKTMLGTNNMTLYYVLATPTYTLLNDTLQTQLNNLQYALAYDTQTNISQTNNDLPFIIDAETYTKINVPTKTSDLTNDNGFITSNYHDDTKQNIVDESLTTVNKTIPTAINEVDSIAKGANQALSYGNYSAMVTAFNSLANNVYNVGQNVMIITLQVPDLWISGIESTSQAYTYTTDEAFTTALSTNGYIQVGYYKLSALETQKVDLTDYATKTYVNNLFNSIVDGDEVNY